MEVVMAGKGAPPGVRYGGRIKGIPNKSTLKKAAIIKRAFKKAGVPLAIENMAEGMRRYMETAALFDEKGETPNQERWEHFYDKAMELAKHVAPYQSAKLQSTTISGNRDQPVSAELVVRFV